MLSVLFCLLSPLMASGYFHNRWYFVVISGFSSFLAAFFCVSSSCQETFSSFTVRPEIDDFFSRRGSSEIVCLINSQHFLSIIFFASPFALEASASKTWNKMQNEGKVFRFFCSRKLLWKKFCNEIKTRLFNQRQTSPRRTFLAMEDLHTTKMLTMMVVNNFLIF